MVTNLLDDVVPINQPVMWLFQPPRSGGTMFLRLFDCHPEVHTHPAPMSFGWQPAPDISKVEERFNLAKYSNVGFRKKASNNLQPSVLIDFDEHRYRCILSHARTDTPRAVFDAANTARFNAWRNYRNLHGPKRYVLMHSTIWKHTPVSKLVPRFFAAYPDGYMIFIARPTEDWLASGAKLEGSKLNDMEAALEEYASAYDAYYQARQANMPDRMMVLEFNRLVREPTTVLSQLCDRLGIAYHSALETTTVNGTPVAANSAHAVAEKFAPDPALIGWGAEIREAAQKLPNFDAARRLFEVIASKAAG